ncbi:MAG: hypothetical protein RL389_25 [Actinomycetota bacterium]|jgi:hypothetical protein
MGRHEARRITLTSRLGSPIAAVIKRSGLKTSLAKSTTRRAWGFAIISSLALVTVVDPYFGTLSSYAADTEYIDYFDEAEKSQPVTVSLTRGGYEVLTGAAASKVFVELASIPSANTVQAIAFGKMKSRGWGLDQYSCLVKLWNRESNWRVNAFNTSSGAYGIPQSLPGSKMAVAGADWKTNPETQINWGIGYIEGRYGDPCTALAHSDRVNWY